MRLTDESHRRLESFLRAHTGEDALVLPSMIVLCGLGARLLTRALGASGVTLGRVVFVAPDVVRSEGGGRVVSGALMAHEAAHVLQYRTAGLPRFLAAYGLRYGAALLRGRSWRRRARDTAYRAIPAEREAFALQAAYQRWKEATDLRLI